MCVCVCSVAHICPTLCDLMDCIACQAPLSLDLSGNNTAVGCHFLLQRMILTQGQNSHLLRWQADSLPLCQLGSSTYSINLSVTEYSSTPQVSYLHFMILIIDTLHFILYNICKPKMTGCGGLLRTKIPWFHIVR